MNEFQAGSIVMWTELGIVERITIDAVMYIYFDRVGFWPPTFQLLSNVFVDV